MTTSTAYNYLDPDQVEIGGIDRRRAFAETLRQQAMQSPQGQMVSGHYVAPAFTQQIMPLVSALAGRYAQGQVDTDTQSLMDKIRTRNATETSGFLDALRGKAAQPEVQGNNPSAYSPEQAGAAPDRSRALAIALQSRNPTLQGVGGKMVQSDADVADLQSVLGAVNGGQPPAAGAAPTGAPGATAGGQSPSFGGVNPLVAALMLKGGNLAKLGDLIQDSNKPIPLREGDLVVPDGKGGFASKYTQPKMAPGITPQRDATGAVVGASDIPGYADSAGRIAGAEAGGKAGFDMVTVNTPQGPKLMTRAQAAQMSGQGAQPAQPTLPPAGMPQPAPNAAAPQPGDKDRALILQTELQSAQQRLTQLQSDPRATPDLLRRAQEDVAGVTKELQRSKIPQTGAPGIPLQSEAASAFEKTMGNNQADALTKSHTAAKTAADDLIGINEGRKALQGGVFIGSGAETKLAIAKFLNANVPGVSIDPEKVSNTDYLKSTLGQSLLNQAKTLGSNPSNADASRINDIVGSIGKDPNAMRKILDWRQMMAERAIQLHNTSVGQAVQNGFTPQFDMTVKAPALNGGAEKKVVRTGTLNGRKVHQYSDGTTDYAD